MNAQNMTSLEAIAKIAHQINKAYCQSMGDFSQCNWDEAPDWQKKSAIQGVNFHVKNTDAGVEENHESWMKEKIDEGWVYGEEKNPDAEPPTHPCIVPFEKLDKEQQATDFIFRAVVHELLTYSMNELK